jgi:hypothetical protein
MQIEFDLNQEDFVDLNIHLNHRRAAGRWLLIARWALMILQIAVLVYIFYPYIEAGGAALALALLPSLGVAGLWLVVIPFVYRLWVRSQVLAVITAERAGLGHHVLTLSDTGVSDRTSRGENSSPWHEIEEIAPTRKHLFLYDGPASAYVIPRRAFPDGDAAEAFEMAVQDYHDQVRHHIPADRLRRGGD